MQPWDRLLLVRVKGFEDYREDDWMVTPLTAAEMERIQKAAEITGQPPTCVLDMMLDYAIRNCAVRDAQGKWRRLEDDSANAAVSEFSDLDWGNG